MEFQIGIHPRRAYPGQTVDLWWNPLSGRDSRLVKLLAGDKPAANQPAWVQSRAGFTRATLVAPTEPGVYTLVPSGPVPVTLTVVPRPDYAKRIERAAPGDLPSHGALLAAKLEALHRAGGGSLLLDPGYYVIDSELWIPSNTLISGRGHVTLARSTADGAAGTDATRLFRFRREPTTDSIVENLHLRSHDTGGFLAFHSIGDTPPARNITLRDLRLSHQCDMRTNIVDSTIERCEFDRTGVAHNAGFTAIRHCQFTGFPVSRGGGQYLRLNGQNFLVEDVTFDRTEGPMLAGVTDSCFRRIEFRNIWWADNRSETWLAEDQPFCGNLIHGVRWANCHGPLIQFWGGDAHDNLFFDLYSTGGSNSVFITRRASNANATFNNIHFRYFEFRDIACLADVDPGSSRIYFQDGAVVGLRPHRTHQFDETHWHNYDPAKLALTRGPADAVILRKVRLVNSAQTLTEP